MLSLFYFLMSGKLTIGGLNLENATLKTATFDKSITLKNAKYKQVNLNSYIIAERFSLDICSQLLYLNRNHSKLENYT